MSRCTSWTPLLLACCLSGCAHELQITTGYVRTVPRATQPTFTTEVTIHCRTCTTLEDLESFAFLLATRDAADLVLAHVQQATEHRGACTITGVTPLRVSHAEIMTITAKVHITCPPE